jgi:nucleoid DNA-binding protein
MEKERCMTVTKRDLALKVSEVTGIRKSSCAVMLSVLLDAMRDTLRTGGPIEIHGFGTFEVKKNASTSEKDVGSPEEICFTPERFLDTNEAH